MAISSEGEVCPSSSIVALGRSAKRGNMSERLSPPQGPSLAELALESALPKAKFCQESCAVLRGCAAS
eukprot:6173898-Pleurochrysis_carterae.AAC.2